MRANLKSYDSFLAHGTGAFRLRKSRMLRRSLFAERHPIRKRMSEDYLRLKELKCSMKANRTGGVGHLKSLNGSIRTHKIGQLYETANRTVILGQETIVVSRVRGRETSMVQCRDARLVATDFKRSRRSGVGSDKPKREGNIPNSPRRARNAQKQQKQALLTPINNGCEDYMANANEGWEQPVW